MSQPDKEFFQNQLKSLEAQRQQTLTDINNLQVKLANIEGALEITRANYNFFFTEKEISEVGSVSAS